MKSKNFSFKINIFAYFKWINQNLQKARFFRIVKIIITKRNTNFFSKTRKYFFPENSIMHKVYIIFLIFILAWLLHSSLVYLLSLLKCSVVEAGWESPGKSSPCYTYKASFIEALRMVSQHIHHHHTVITRPRIHQIR